MQETYKLDTRPVAVLERFTWASAPPRPFPCPRSQLALDARARSDTKLIAPDSLLVAAAAVAGKRKEEQVAEDARGTSRSRK